MCSKKRLLFEMYGWRKDRYLVIQDLIKFHEGNGTCRNLECFIMNKFCVARICNLHLAKSNGCTRTNAKCLLKVVRGFRIGRDDIDRVLASFDDEYFICVLLDSIIDLPLQSRLWRHEGNASQVHRTIKSSVGAALSPIR